MRLRSHFVTYSRSRGVLLERLPLSSVITNKLLLTHHHSIRVTGNCINIISHNLSTTTTSSSSSQEPLNAHSNQPKLNETETTAASNKGTEVVPLSERLPPYAVRLALVGSSVGLASPLFIIGGITYGWFNYLPKTDTGRLVKYTSGIAVGGGLIRLIHEYIGPFLMNNSDIVLPFAISNALSATVWYALAEKKFGIEKLVGTNESRDSETILEKGTAESTDTLTLMKNLKNMTVATSIGPLVGGLAAMTSPFLWPFAFEYLWSDELRCLILGDNLYWLSHLYEFIVLPVALPVGVLSGFMIQSFLRPIIVGNNNNNQKWTRSSALPVLALLMSSFGAYFYFCKTPSDEYYWVERLNIKDGGRYSHNPKTGHSLEDSGERANTITRKRSLIQNIAGVANGSISVASILTDNIKDFSKPDQAKNDLVWINSNKVTLSNLPNYEKGQILLDILSRLKKLEIDSDIHCSKEILSAQVNKLKDYIEGSILHATLNNKYYKDWFQVVADLEVLIVLKKKVANSKDPSNEHCQTMIRELATKLANALCIAPGFQYSFFADVMKSRERRDAELKQCFLALLKDTNPIEEQFLKDLDYKVNKNEEHAEKVIKTYSSKRWQRILIDNSINTVLTMTPIVVSLLYYFSL